MPRISNSHIRMEIHSGMREDIDYFTFPSVTGILNTGVHLFF